MIDLNTIGKRLAKLGDLRVAVTPGFKYLVDIPNLYIEDSHGVLESVTGYGESFNGAALNLYNQIIGNTVVINPKSKNEKVIFVLGELEGVNEDDM